MELTNLGMQALEHFVHAGDAITAQLNHVLDTVQAAGPGPEGEKTTCEVCRCTFEASARCPAMLDDRTPGFSLVAMARKA